MTRHDLISWLQETNDGRLDELWRQADTVRRAQVGDEVHLRGLVEISNVCVRRCAYCGLRAGNQTLVRYRMTPDEILACARHAAALGYGTVVLQAGEDPELPCAHVADFVRRIKAETRLAVTLSLGERPRDEWAAWKAAGADRYLLRFETSNRALFAQIHPPRAGVSADRMASLGVLRELGYEVGSGVMIGLPGQSFDDLANDLEAFRRLDLDMIGVGPYLPHPATPMGRGDYRPLPVEQQVPNSELMTYKVVALTRLMCPRANIPSTTALATLNKSAGRELGLQRGANVVMPNLTPPEYRRHYEIYPGKVCFEESDERHLVEIERRIRALGRVSGRGRGDSLNWCARQVASISATCRSASENGCSHE